jgi:hypothetical protein
MTTIFDASGNIGENKISEAREKLGQEVCT